MFSNELTPLVMFLAVTGVVLLFAWILNKHQGRVESRLADLLGKDDRFVKQQEVAKEEAKKRKPKKPVPDLKGDGRRAHIRQALHQAGYYRPTAPAMFMMVKTLLILVPWGLAVLLLLSGWLKVIHCLTIGAALSATGMLAPSFWLDHKRKQRRNAITRGLPDMLDVMVVCLEGGLSLPAAFQHLAQEFQSAHKVLGSELGIVQWEVQLGETVGEAFEHFAARCGIEEVKGISGMFKQNERYGAGLVTALRAHAELLRFKRIQETEEKAQKAGTQILFPTILFIFPGIFVILLGPAAIHIRGVMGKMKGGRSQKSDKKESRNHRSLPWKESTYDPAVRLARRAEWGDGSRACGHPTIPGFVSPWSGRFWSPCRLPYCRLQCGTGRSREWLLTAILPRHQSGMGSRDPAGSRG